MYGSFSTMLMIWSSLCMIKSRGQKRTGMLWSPPSVSTTLPSVSFLFYMILGLIFIQTPASWYALPFPKQGVMRQLETMLLLTARTQRLSSSEVAMFLKLSI